MEKMGTFYVVSLPHFELGFLTLFAATSASHRVWVGWSCPLWDCLCEWCWSRECSQGSAELWGCAEHSPHFTGSPGASLSAALQPVWCRSVRALPCESCSAHQLWGCVKLWNNLPEIKQVQDLCLLCPQNQLLCNWGKLNWCGGVALFQCWLLLILAIPSC